MREQQQHAADRQRDHAIHMSARGDSRVSSKPSTSASAGNSGRMYEGSFEPDRLKNTKTKAGPDEAEAGPREAVRRHAAASRQLRGSVHAHTSSQGNMPTTNHGTK